MAVGAGLGMGVGVGAGLGMGVGVGAGLGMVGWLVGGVSFGTPVRCTGALSCRHCCFVYLQLPLGTPQPPPNSETPRTLSILTAA